MRNSLALNPHLNSNSKLPGLEFTECLIKFFSDAGNLLAADPRASECMGKGIPLFRGSPQIHQEGEIPVQTFIPGGQGKKKSSLNLWSPEVWWRVVKVRRTAWLSDRNIFYAQTSWGS